MSGNCVRVDPGMEMPEVHVSKWRVARKAYRCTECEETIQRGDRYEYVRGLWEGSWGTYRTCARCLGVRADYFKHGWTYTMMAEDFMESFHFDYRDGIPPDFAPCGKSMEALP